MYSKGNKEPRPLWVVVPDGSFGCGWGGALPVCLPAGSPGLVPGEPGGDGQERRDAGCYE